MVVGAEIDILGVVPDQRVEHVDLEHVVVFLFKLEGDRLALIVHAQTVQQVGREQDADARRDGHVEEAHVVLLRDAGGAADHVGVERREALVEDELFEGCAADLQRGAVDDLLVVVAQAAPGLDGFGGRVDLLIIRRGLRRRDGGGLRRGRRLGVDPAGLGAFGRRSGRLDGDRGQGLLDGGLIDLGIGDHVLRDAVHPVERRRHVQPALAAGEGIGVPGADAVEEVAVHERFDREFRELRQPALLAHRLGRAQREDQRDDAEGKEHREKGRGEPAAAGADPFVLLP